MENTAIIIKSAKLLLYQQFWISSLWIPLQEDAATGVTYRAAIVTKLNNGVGKVNKLDLNVENGSINLVHSQHLEKIFRSRAIFVKFWWPFWKK
jgi:hypothetical protein